MSTTVHFAELAEVLSRLHYPEPPSAYHGSVCGALCAQPPEQLDPAALLEGADPADGQSREFLLRLRDESNAALLSDEMEFEPLLPEDEWPLSVRVEALSAWCSGFLYGLSSRRPLDLKACSEEARETLRDFTQFTQAGFDASGDPETEEAAYAELVEYVRVGAQLLVLELRPRPPSIDNESTTVH